MAQAHLTAQASGETPWETHLHRLDLGPIREAQEVFVGIAIGTGGLYDRNQGALLRSRRRAQPTLERRKKVIAGFRQRAVQTTLYRIKECLGVHWINARILQTRFQRGNIQPLQIFRFGWLACFSWHPAKNTD
jgi:hypothetical protein